MVKLQILPEETLSLQVSEPIVKTGLPVILPKHITANGSYYAGTENASGYDPVTVDVDMTPALEEGYEKGYADGEVAGEKNGALQYAITARFGNLNLFGKKEIEVYVPNLMHATQMFSPTVANTTVEHITVIGGTEPTLTYAHQMFNMTWKGGPLKHITLDIDFSKVTNAGMLFTNHSATVTIDGRPLDFSSATGTLAFSYLSLLEYIRFAPATMKQSLDMSACKSLSDASIQSIVDGLADLTGATAQTVNFHADVGAKLTEEQKLSITLKNWTLVY